MAADRTVSVPSPAGHRQLRRPFSLASLEVVIARAVALFGLLFGAQALPLALGQREYIDPVWWLVVVVAIYGSLVANVIAAVLRRGTRYTNSAIAILFLLALLLWVPGVADSGWIAARPWLWFMITVATASAAVAAPVWLATGYLLVTPVLYGALRLSEFGGSANPVITALDVLFAVLLGGAVLAIITMLRSAASAVDSAQSTALSRYLDAVGEHAREVERVQVDAIVHDTVLSAFLAAGRAETDEHREQATRLAKNAVVRLKAAEVAPTEDAGGVFAQVVARRITEANGRMPESFRLEFEELCDTVLPVVAAESLYSATLQAMVNSTQHAGDGVERWVRIRRRADGGIRIEVGDSGVGFIVDEIPAERLGVRVSIAERMLGSGGEARIESAPQQGTLVFIDWPRSGLSAESTGGRPS